MRARGSRQSILSLVAGIGGEMARQRSKRRRRRATRCRQPSGFWSEAPIGQGRASPSATQPCLRRPLSLGPRRHRRCDTPPEYGTAPLPGACTKPVATAPSGHAWPRPGVLHKAWAGVPVASSRRNARAAGTRTTALDERRPLQLQPPGRAHSPPGPPTCLPDSPDPPATDSACG